MKGDVSSFLFCSCESAARELYSILNSPIQKIHRHSRADPAKEHQGDKEVGAHKVIGGAERAGLDQP